MDILDTVTGMEIIEASDRRDEAIEQEFMTHVARVKASLALPDHRARPHRRDHINDKGDVISASWTYILYGDLHGKDLVPLLVGSVVRETNHSLLSVLDRTGSTPVVHETTFNTRDFVAAVTT